MRKLILLLKYELNLYMRIHNLSSYIFIYSLMAIFAMSMITSPHNLSYFGLLITLIIYVLTTLNITTTNIKRDLEDGSLEGLLLTINVYSIVIVKIMSLFIAVIIPFMISVPIISIIYNISWWELTTFTISSLLLFLQIASVVTLISAVQSYFFYNSHFAAITTIPLIIPGLIITGLIIESSYDVLYLELITLGITLIILPISIILCTFLINNIYNN